MRSRCHEAERSISQALCAAFDVGGRERIDFLPSKAAVDAALDVESLWVNDDERPFVAGDHLSFRDGCGEITPHLAIDAGARFFSAEPELAAHDAERGTLGTTSGVRAVPRLAGVGACPRVFSQRVGHDK